MIGSISPVRAAHGKWACEGSTILSVFLLLLLVRSGTLFSCSLSSYPHNILKLGLLFYPEDSGSKFPETSVGLYQASHLRQQKSSLAENL